MTQKAYPPKADPTQSDKGRFSDLGIAKNFLDILDKKGFDTPTPIQHQIIPGALQGKDVVGIAQTGTGKTLAFGIPMIQRLGENKGQGLILVPTRELALQVEAAFRQIGAPLGLRTVVVIGGTSQRPQVKLLKQNPHVVIATPGRLADLMQQKVYNLNRVSVITLDEADRMLDVGFLPEIKRILSAAPKERQIMLFSATMPQSISTLATTFMKLPIRIEIAPQGTSAKNVEQEVFVVRKNDKMRLLDAILEEYKTDKILIFSRTKHGAKRIARDIRFMGHSSTEIHGNRSLNQRTMALAGFTKGKYRIMVATDIAARGIDVPDIGIVLNFDLPDNSEDYVHRIGRTARAGRSGKAISFVTPSEKADVKKIERLIRKSLPVLSLPALPPQRDKAPREEREPGTKSRYQKRNEYVEKSKRRNKYSRANQGRNSRSEGGQERSADDRRGPQKRSASGQGGEESFSRGRKSSTRGGYGGNSNGRNSGGSNFSRNRRGPAQGGARRSAAPAEATRRRGGNQRRSGNR